MSEAVRSVWRCFIVRNFPSPVDFHPLRPSHPVPDGVEYVQASRRDRHSSSGYDRANYLKRKKQRDELLGTPNEFEGDRRGRQQWARKKHPDDGKGADATPLLVVFRRLSGGDQAAHARTCDSNFSLTFGCAEAMLVGG